MGSCEQSVELRQEQISDVTCPVLLTSLNKVCPKRLFAVLRHDFVQLSGRQGCFAINLQGDPQCSHFLHGIDRSVHLEIRDCKPDNGDQNQEGHGLRAAFTTIPKTHDWAHPQSGGKV